MGATPQQPSIAPESRSLAHADYSERDRATGEHHSAHGPGRIFRARGRTIELFAEEHTEEESFKGIMAMGGCLLLVMALGVLVVAVIVEGLRLPMRSWPLWRLCPSLTSTARSNSWPTPGSRFGVARRPRPPTFSSMRWCRIRPTTRC